MPKNNILVTGAKGQLGQSIHVLVKDKLYSIEDAHFYFTDKETLDIANKDAIEKYIRQYNIRSIVNCAAYTAVDKAESNEALAYKINAEATGYLAELSLEYNIKLIHISTDYIFNKISSLPFTEEDETSPKSVYGKSKLAGENILKKINPKNAIIIRTSWVYSHFGSNFVKTMLKLGKSRESLTVVSDQIGTPTYARDLAQVILKILDFNYNSKTVLVYNYSNEGACSWYDFAQLIFKLSNTNCMVSPIPTTSYPTPAKRPLYSILNKTKIKKDFDIEIPLWEDSLVDCIKVLEKS